MLIRRAPLVATLVVASSLALGGLASASETKIFVIDSSDGYGIDTCVADGASCGAAMAGAWCRVHDYSRAISYGKVQNDAVVTTVSTAATALTACYGSKCTDAVAITCEK